MLFLFGSGLSGLGDSTIKPVAVTQPVIEVRPTKKESTPFITFTLAITEGTYGVSGKVLDVGVESVSSEDEKDIVGVRDNEPVTDGHENGELQTTTRTGYSGSVAGFGGSDITETKKDQYGITTDTKKTETLTSPVVSAVKETDKNGKVTNTSSTQVFGFKAGAHYGVEVGLQINWGYTGVPNVAPTYNDNLVPRRLVLPVPVKKK